MSHQHVKPYDVDTWTTVFFRNVRKQQRVAVAFARTYGIPMHSVALLAFHGYLEWTRSGKLQRRNMRKHKVHETIYRIKYELLNC
jgi:hypothetical protein